LVNNGCGRVAIHAHIAAGRREETSVCFAASQFTSGLRPVMLTRSVPKPVGHDRRKLPFNLRLKTYQIGTALAFGFGTKLTRGYLATALLDQLDSNKFLHATPTVIG
jgi:hypothetical protein